MDGYLYWLGKLRLIFIFISQVGKMSFYFILLCCLKQKKRWSCYLKEEYAKYSIYLKYFDDVNLEDNLRF